MYNNIGGKIKSLAKGACIVEALGSIIVGVILAGDDVLYLLLALIGPIIAWVSSWILYAFGELVEDISIMRHQITGEAKELELKSTEKIAKQKSAQKEKTFEKTYCEAESTTIKVGTINEERWINKAKFSTMGNETIICSQCKFEQPSNRKVCWRCGAKFENK